MPITMKFGMEEYIVGLHMRAKCCTGTYRGWGVQEFSKMKILVKIAVFDSFAWLYATSPLLLFPPLPSSFPIFPFPCSLLLCPYPFFCFLPLLFLFFSTLFPSLPSPHPFPSLLFPLLFLPIFLSYPFPFSARVEVNISLAFLYCVRIALHP